MSCLLQTLKAEATTSRALREVDNGRENQVAASAGLWVGQHVLICCFANTLACLLNAEDPEEA